MATGFLHTFGIQAQSTIFNSLQSFELYMAVFAEWQNSQHLKETGYNDLGPSYGPFSKVM